VKKSNPVSRRGFFKIAGIGTAAAALAALPHWACSGFFKRKRPNILFIMADDHGYQAISAYDGRINRTPHIDRLASEGVRFTQSFCTNSICAPSRAVLLTGKYSHINGVIDNSVEFDAGQMTFPKLLQKAGYETALFGKWHLKTDPAGFDFWNILPGQGQYYNPDFIEMGERKQRSGYVTDLITDDCLNWLNTRTSGKPFCVLMHHKAPHRNWMPGPKQLHLYEDQDIPVPDTFEDDYASRSDAARQQEMRIADHLYMAYDLKLAPEPSRKPATSREKTDEEYWTSVYDRLTGEQKTAWDSAYGPQNAAFRKANLKGKQLAEWKYQRYIKDYLRCIASVDENIGRVLDYLDETDIAENTLIVYTSDQGFYLGEHGWFDKRFMYEESLRIPLIIRYPRSVQPHVNEKDMVLNLDFAPTFLDFAGVDVPNAMQGRSLRNVLRGKSPKNWRQSIYYHYFEYPAVHGVKRHYGVRTHRYKLIHFYYDIDAWELYDLKEDPHELKNLIENPDYADILEELKEELERLQKEYGDTDVTGFLPQESVRIDHLAVGCPVQRRHPYSRRYPAGGDNGLTDGTAAPDSIRHPVDMNIWQGYEGHDLDLVVDLGSVHPVHTVSAGCLQNIENWIFLPEWVEISLSVDGRTFSDPRRAGNPVPIDYKVPVKQSFTVSVPSTQARFVRIHAKNIGLCPSWHPGSGRKSWLFADEIIVH
jgi:arylsulfatase A-like enzyme